MRRRGTDCYDHINFAADKVGGHGGQPIVVTFGPAPFDHHVLPLEITGFAQSLAQRGQQMCTRARRRVAEEADHRHRPLLRPRRARRYRGRRHRTKNDATLHSITLSA